MKRPDPRTTDGDRTRSRRSVLGAVVGVGVATGLSGCAGGTDDNDDAGGGPGSTSPGTTGGGSTDTTDALDLREANVTAVAVEGSGTDLDLAVTLYHDDDGESGYANWWQVESTTGERLGRRTLGHAHGTREFTRSETVSVPSDLRRFVVRGHDQTHGYGGQAAVVTVDTGAVELVRQGPDPRSFADWGE